MAVSQDSCDQLVHIAFGIAESKNSSSWNWFLEKLSFIIQINNEETIIFSDREKGIINSVNNIAPLRRRKRSFRGGSVIVWGCISRSRLVLLRKLVGALSTAKYCGFLC